MIYAQIKNNVVMNTIVVDEDTPLDLFSRGFDHFLRIDLLEPRPSIGYLYNDGVFSPPPPEEPVE